MLPHYSPLKVAEVFRVLHAMYPGRIDLGIGRAPGGTPLDTFALQRYRGQQLSVDDFPATTAGADGLSEPRLPGQASV